MFFRKESKMTFQFKPLTSHMGAEVTGFDPRSDFDAATGAALYQALLEHRVLLFRGTPLTEEQQVRLSRVAGELTFRGGGNYADPSKQSSLVSNAHEDGLFGNGELSFHSDLSFTPHILKARSLHALLIPVGDDAGGDTLWADVVRSCAELDPELRARVEHLKARFAATYTYPDGRVQTLEHVRPLLDTHPVTGKRFISASRAVTKEVIGMERAEYRPLLKALWAHMERPEFVWRHKWKVGDTVLWDNIATQHARTTFDANQKRALRAVSIDDPAVRAAVDNQLAASAQA